MAHTAVFSALPRVPCKPNLTDPQASLKSFQGLPLAQERLVLVLKIEMAQNTGCG